MKITCYNYSLFFLPVYETEIHDQTPPALRWPAELRIWTTVRTTVVSTVLAPVLFGLGKWVKLGLDASLITPPSHSDSPN